MITTYLLDEINIVSYSKDQWGKSTRSVQSGIAARVEDVQKWVKDKNGNELLANTLIIIKPDNTIAWNDKIQITKRHGIIEVTADKEYAIKSLSSAGGFVESQYEVYI